MFQTFEQEINMQPNSPIKREPQNPFSYGSQFNLALFAQAVMPDVRRVGNDGRESSRKTAGYKITNLNPAEVVPSQSEFFSVGKGRFVKFKPLKLAGVSDRTGCGKKCSRPNCGIKQRVWLFFGYPQSHDFCKPRRGPELPFLSQFLAFHPCAWKRLKTGLNCMGSSHLSSPVSEVPKILQRWLSQLKPPTVKSHIRQNVSVLVFDKSR